MSHSINFTRQQYLNEECSHEQYYSQFVTSSTLSLVGSLGKDRLQNAYAIDTHLNTIPLKEWDNLAFYMNVPVSDMKLAGDYPTEAALVCILKVAAVQLIKPV